MIPLRVMGPQNDANAGGTPFSAVADCDDLSALEWDDAFSEISPSIQPRQRKSVPPPVIDSGVSESNTVLISVTTAIRLISLFWRTNDFGSSNNRRKENGNKK